MTIDNPLFQKFTDHVLLYEGGLSKDPIDTAASCAPYAGAYHTNRGVTYCTFRSHAGQLGITPVTYERFLNLTPADTKKFLYYYYQTVQGDRIPDLTGLAMTEAAWGSGPQRAVIHLQSAINKLGGSLTVDGAIGPKTIAAANVANAVKLYDQYWKERKAFIEYLISKPQYFKYRNGWRNRIAGFLAKFPVSGIVIGGTGILLIALALIFRKDLGLS